MATREILIFVIFATLVCASEVDDAEQKKRAAGKATSLNAIPTGAQKPEYTYSIYQQSPSSQSQPSPNYQSQQVSSSFYPNQGASQYYTSASSPTDAASSYPPQPQLSLIPPQSTSQFVPLNFIPNPGYQSKYQIIPSKSPNGNIQVAFLQPSPNFAPQYQPLFSPQPQHLNPHQSQFVSQIPQQGPYNVAPNYQQVPFGAPYLGQQSPMVLFAQSNPSLYNNLLYPNPVQSFYNYYPSNSQAKYNLSYGSSPLSNEYEKQGPITQALPKEDNEISAHNSEYISQADPSNYKNSYAESRGTRTTYSKLN